MVMVGNCMEDVLFGGQRTAPLAHPAAQRAAGGMRIAQRKNKRKDAPGKDQPAILPNEQLGEVVPKVQHLTDATALMPAEVRLFTRAQKQRVLHDQAPAHDKYVMANQKPNVKRTGPIMQPRQGF